MTPSKGRRQFDDLFSLHRSTITADSHHYCIIATDKILFFISARLSYSLEPEKQKSAAILRARVSWFVFAPNLISLRFFRRIVHTRRALSAAAVGPRLPDVPSLCSASVALENNKKPNH